MKVLFRANNCVVRRIEENDLQRTLEVYQQVEDFLFLGLVAKASMEMVQADIEHSKKSGGLFCVIDDRNGNQIGVIDFVPETTKGTAFLSLLMISQKHRHQGNGQAIVNNLESYLKQNYGTHTIESGVQTNNSAGIAFWKRCGFEIGQTAKALNDGTVVYDMKKYLAYIAL
jgi:RimJ/RimL family protein N-acetyltransferase